MKTRTLDRRTTMAAVLLFALSLPAWASNPKPIVLDSSYHHDLFGTRPAEPRCTLAGWRP